MSIKRRDIGGFTLVEVLVVVVILAILAAIAVPIYLQYVESARAGEAQEAIGAIWAAAKVHHAETGDWPRDLNQLRTRLTLDPIVQRRWDFTIQGGGTRGIQRIQATSTPQMPGGGGRQVVFNATTGKWTGYGTD
jgi:prepilin-type N-terminal cleavage/methylation domain-containing protein